MKSSSFPLCGHSEYGSEGHVQVLSRARAVIFKPRHASTYRGLVPTPHPNWTGRILGHETQKLHFNKLPKVTMASRFGN